MKKIIAVLIIIVLNTSAIFWGIQAEGVYASGGFYKLKERGNDFVYYLGDVSVTVTNEEEVYKVRISRDEDELSLQATVREEQSQTSIELLTIDGSTRIWRGVYDTTHSRQITSIPENTIVELENIVVNMTKENMTIVFSDSSYDIDWNVLSAMIINDTVSVISSQWGLVCLGIVFQVLGICIFVLKNKFIQLEKWIVGFFYKNTDNLQSTSLYTGLYIFMAGLLFAIGVISMCVVIL